MTVGRFLVFGAIAAGAAGCALVFSPPPAQSDAGVSTDGSHDSPHVDHAAPGDAGGDSRPDVTMREASTKDAGSGDVFVADHSSPHDTGRHDTGMHDSGMHDSGVTDTGTHVDAGLVPYWWMSDTFDSTLGLGLWDGTPAVDTGLATLAIVDGGVAPHSGCCALQTTASVGSPSYATISRVWETSGRPMAPPVTSGTVAIRAFLQTAALASDTRELAVAGASGSTLWYLTTGMGGSPPVWSSFLVSPANPGGVGETAATTAPVFDGKWHCTEIQMNVSSGAGEVAIFVDGVEQGLTYNGNTSPPDGGWVAATVGLGHSSGEAPVNLFFDDVVIALYTERSTPPRPYIGCGAWPQSTQ